MAVDKVYRFRRGRYDIGMEYHAHNLGSTPYAAATYLQIQRRHNPPQSSYLRFNIDSYSFTGPVVYDPENKFQKLQVTKLAEEPFHRKAAGGWIASIQHHFLAGAIPPPDEEFTYDLTLDKDVYTLSAIGRPLVIAARREGIYQPAALRRAEAAGATGPGRTRAHADG